MLFLAEMLVLLGVLKLLAESGRPVLCAAIFTMCTALIAMLVGVQPALVLLVAAFVFVFTTLWFGMLNRYELATFQWFVVLFAGFVAAYLIGAMWQYAAGPAG